MAKCGKKVKNACKMCLQPVTQKTGLQCQGACLSWVHYSCLNYTPGRIRDIKNGIIKVTCPCPDCQTKYPKEYRTDDTFSCANERCPANNPPKCQNIRCPSNNVPLRPTSGTSCSMPPECGLECKRFGAPSQTADAKTNVTFSNHRIAPNASQSPCPSSCPSTGDVSGDMNRGGDAFPSMAVVEQMCNTVGQLSTQINELMVKMKQAMQEQQGGGRGKGGGGGAGGGCMPKTQMGCTQKGPKSKCPKPCYCPGNPAARK